MPSDSNGLYSLPAGYLATTGLTILASQHNPPLEDIAAGLTARLMRSGVAPMTGVFKIVDGAVGAPAVALNTAPTWGLYKTSTGWGFAVSGANVFETNPTTTVLPAALTVAGNATVSKTLITHDGGDIASANALTLGDGNIFNITGTTAITSIGTKGIGTLVWLRFDGILTLTHHVTNLILTNAANITTAAADWALFEEYVSGKWRMLIYSRANGTALQSSLPRGYIDGCIMSNGTDATNDINITAGVCRDSTNSVNITVPAITKQLDANWAVGSAAGMRNSAAGIANGTYHIYAVSGQFNGGDIYAVAGVAGTDPDSSASIAAIITALNAEPFGGANSGYAYARRIGSILRESATIIPFTQVGEDFLRTAPFLSTSTAPTATAAMVTLAIPLGIKLLAKINANVAIGSAAIDTWISSPDQTDSAPSTTAAPGSNLGGNSQAASAVRQDGNFEIRTDASAQVRWRSTGTASAGIMVTVGWRDRRGTNAA